MSAPDQLSLSVRAWLDEGTRPLSDDVRASVIAALPSLRQDRAFGRRWRVDNTDVADRRRHAFRLLAVAGVIVATLLALVAALAGVGQSPPTGSRFLPGSIAFTRGGALFVAAPDGSEPVAVEASGLGEGEFAFSPDRTYLGYMADGDSPAASHELIVVDADGRRVLSKPNDDYETFSWAPGSDELASYAYRTTVVSVIGIDGVTTRTIPLVDAVGDPWLSTTPPTPLAGSPDGRWFAAPVGYKDAGHYIVFAADGSARTFGTLLIPDPYGPFAWAPDGHFALARGIGSEVAVLSADGDLRTAGLPTVPVPATLRAGWMAWSPDGTRLAVAMRGDTPSAGRIVVVDGDGTSRTLPIDQTALSFTSQIGGVGAVDWSPDGQRILFMTNPNEDAPASAIWSVDLAGGDLKELVTGVDGYRFDVAGTPDAGGRGR